MKASGIQNHADSESRLLSVTEAEALTGIATESKSWSTFMKASSTICKTDAGRRSILFDSFGILRRVLEPRQPGSGPSIAVRVIGFLGTHAEAPLIATTCCVGI